jgi:hypothetical protein
MTELTAAGMKAPVWSPRAWPSPLKKLYIQVLIAIALGILLGVVYPSVAVDMKPFSDGFITLIRAVVPPIIFATEALAGKEEGVAILVKRIGNDDLLGAFAPGTEDEHHISIPYDVTPVFHPVETRVRG